MSGKPPVQRVLVRRISRYTISGEHWNRGPATFRVPKFTALEMGRRVLHDSLERSGSDYEGARRFVVLPLLGVVLERVPCSERVEKLQISTARRSEQESECSPPELPASFVGAPLSREADAPAVLPVVRVALKYGSIKMGTSRGYAIGGQVDFAV